MEAAIWSHRTGSAAADSRLDTTALRGTAACFAPAAIVLTARAISPVIFATGAIYIAGTILATAMLAHTAARQPYVKDTGAAYCGNAHSQFIDLG